MAGISRATAALFGTTGLTPVGGFAGAANGVVTTEVGSSNSVSNIQTGQSGAFAGGWLSATLGSSKFPAIEDMNAVDLVFSTQIAYLLERGIPEYDAGTSYNIGDVCRAVGLTTIYKSLINANLGNLLSNATDWQFCGDLTNLAGSNLYQLITGTSHAFTSSDIGYFTARSNSGVAMADTFPGTSGALVNGAAGIIKNVDTTKPIVITVGSGGTFNQGNLTGTVYIQPGETWAWESQGSGTYNFWRVAPATLYASPDGGSFNGLQINQASTTTVTVNVSEIVLEDASANTRRVTGITAQTLNCGTTGANALDTGALGASTFYYMFAIFNPSTNTTATLASVTAPNTNGTYAGANLPSGYTFSRCIGWFKTNGSSQIFSFYQTDRKTSFATVNAASTTGNVAYLTSLSISTIVPPFVKRVSGTIGNPGGSGGGMVGGVASDTTGNGAQIVQASNATLSVNSYNVAMPFSDLVLGASQTMAYAGLNTGGGTGVRVDISAATF